MLIEVYRYALKNRDAKARKITDSNYESIMSQAAARWSSYKPQPKTCNTAGVDSSWNKRALQGLNLYAIDAIAVTSANEILSVEFEVDISDSARNETLESKAMAMEASVASKALSSTERKIDAILVDGSIIPRLRGKSPAAAAGLANQYGDRSVVFISKSSESRAQFGEMGSRAGDIYYYGKASKDAPGYSLPYRAASESGLYVTEVYARLRKGTPIIRLEFLGRTDEQKIQQAIDMLCFRSVSGYPYCLKYAHNNCKISDADIDRLASMFGLQHEPGARVVLNE